MELAPWSYSVALLLLRVWFGILLFVEHGIGKLTNYAAMAAHFPDPVHVGSRVSLLLAILSEDVCSLLLIAGLGTRVVALYIAGVLTIAFLFVHHAHLFGQGNGELPLLYMGPALTLVIAGAGRFSLDARIWRRRV